MMGLGAFLHGHIFSLKFVSLIYFLLQDLSLHYLVKYLSDCILQSLKNDIGIFLVELN